ncbi:MAG: hypothetical protein FD143_138 [Ignavibacteria bacterium]|nr:MAG: hypothetical protein FD143_138 [Ignavibacteria bacterium]KAF0162448.1 MAG: hypothetical protein FD188_51 [Ignavibacteria bacterium]
MKKLLHFLFSCILIVSISFAQGTSGTSAKYEYRYLIDMPTTGVMNKGFAGISMEAMPFGVFITKIELGVFDGVSFGLSYGGGNVIGSGKISWNKLPGINFRVRIIEESLAFPNITAGFESQGKGLFDKTLNRYHIKSPGFFIAASKNFDLLGYFSIHGAINYSLERDDNDKDLNLAFGFEKTIGEIFSMLAEYDIAFNDNTLTAIGEGYGYLNFGLRCAIGDGLTIGLNLRDLLQNKKINHNIADRGLFVELIKGIF